ncbi:MAG: protein kinase [Candidatus Melainabacteria bacterium]|nr:protein kinase [Candidatus Melainabacteria bacterium]
MDPKEPQRPFESFGTSGPVDPDSQNSTRLTSGQAQPASVAKPYISDDKLKPGDIVGENYIIIELLGVGGMGYVYKVRHLILEKVYAMKTISGEQVSELAWRRLQVEAQAIARINHPNIVGIHNLGIHQGMGQAKVPYYVMDYLKGKNLAQILKQKRYLPIEQSLPLFIEICNGLGYAHKKGIVHRDIKPGNIVILDEPDFNGARVKIVDFGIAKLAGTIDPDNQKLTTIGEVFGSPLYMSPEQCEGKRIDSRSDIYSLGCTFFETLTGDVPFYGENPVATMLMHTQDEPPSLYDACGLDFPESLEHLVSTMLEKAPMNRYPNLERVSADLQNILEGREISAAPFNSHGMPHLMLEGGDEEPPRIAAEARAIESIQSITPTKIAVLAGLLLGALVTITIYFFNQRAIDKTTTVATKVLAARKEVIPAEKYSQVLSNGLIQFDFPEKQSIGTISKQSNDKNARQAQGKVIFKRDDRLYFTANEYAVSHPECFDSFSSNDLYSLTMPQSSLVSDIEKASPDCDINKALGHIGQLSALKELNLDLSNITDAAIADLNQLPSLVILKMNFTHITGTGLSKLQRLKQLRYLAFGHNNDCKDMLKALSGSTQIESLYLEGQTIDEESAQLIANCPNLKHLDIEGSTATDKTLEILSKAKKLDYIGVTACQITEAGMAKVKKARASSSLNLARSKKVRTSLENSFGGENPADWIFSK